MKNAVLWVFTIFFLMGSLSATAAEKIAVVDLDEAVLKSRLAMEQQRTLQENAAYTTLLDRFQRLQADLREMQQTAQANGLTWSAAKKAEHENNLKKVFADLRRAGGEIESQRNSVLERIKAQSSQVLKEVVAQIVKDEGISLLLNAGAAHFVEPRLDITEKVTAGLDARR